MLKDFRASTKHNNDLAYRFCAFCAFSWLKLAEGVEGEDGVGEVFADVGGEHGAHAEFFGGEVAGQATDVEGGHGGGDCVGVISEDAVGLREKAGDEARESVASACRTESGVACGVDEDTPIRCGYERARAFENKNHVMSSRKLARGCNTILER